MIGQDEDRYFQVGAQLPPMEKVELVEFLRNNMDVFAWSTYDASRINPEFICHWLNVNPGSMLRRQSPQCSLKKHVEVVKEELNKLKQAWAIKEVFYP